MASVASDICCSHSRAATELAMEEEASRAGRIKINLCFSPVPRPRSSVFCRLTRLLTTYYRSTTQRPRCPATKAYKIATLQTLFLTFVGGSFELTNLWPLIVFSNFPSYAPQILISLSAACKTKDIFC